MIDVSFSGLRICIFVKTLARSRIAKLFGRRVRERRERCGFSQEDLAHAARLHRTHISLVERGERSVRIETSDRLAIALRVRPGELMPAVRLPTRKNQ